MFSSKRCTISEASRNLQDPQKCRRNRDLELYIHKQYNVKTFYTNTNFCDNPMGHVVNSLIRACNENRSCLPRMIIMIMDKEFLKMMKFKDFGISMMIGRCLEWTVRQVHQIVADKWTDLKKKRQGSVLHFEPKIIWMLMPVDDNDNSGLATLKGKFNAILMQVIEQEAEGFILKATDCRRNLFDRNNIFTHEGRITYWRDQKIWWTGQRWTVSSRTS